MMNFQLSQLAQQRMAYEKFKKNTVEKPKMIKVDKPFILDTDKDFDDLVKFVWNENIVKTLVSIWLDTKEKLKWASREELKTLAPMHKSKLYKLLNI